MLWGISSNGRAPASHAGSTGIDTRILQPRMVTTFCSFLSPFLILFVRVVIQDVLHKIAVFYWHCNLWFTLYLQQPRAKMSVDAGDAKERRFANCHPLVLYKSKWWPLNSGLAVS